MAPLTEQLTARELDYARLIAEGLSNRQIAQAAHCSPKYLNNRISLLYEKLGLRSGVRSLEPRIKLALWYAREFGGGRHVR